MSHERNESYLRTLYVCPILGIARARLSVSVPIKKGWVGGPDDDQEARLETTMGINL